MNSEPPASLPTPTSRFSIRFARLRRRIVPVLRAVGFAFAGAVVALVGSFVWILEDRPDLASWHTAVLDAEFTRKTPPDSFADYLACETAVFRQLETRVRDRFPTDVPCRLNRFCPGSLSDPERWPVNWNRTFELVHSAPRVGVLLLHGMSDSPYSLRAVGQRLHAAGATCLGLRLPGHGTAPSGLVNVDWEDMAVAVRMAMEHLRERLGSAPLFLVGYSNGGALAIHYVLTALDSPEIPPVAGIALISPAIGVSRVAALAVWQARLGTLLGMDKLAWNTLGPEYDPFKYNAFAINAGHQVHRLTRDIQYRLRSRQPAGTLAGFPPTLVFQSAVDATVSTDAVVNEFLRRLPPGDRELVLFDIHRAAPIMPLIRVDPADAIAALVAAPDLPFTLRFVTNSEEGGDAVVQKLRRDFEALETFPTVLRWPPGLYSLSHVSLPFPSDDPLYGVVETDPPPPIRLGNVAVRGERGVLRVPPEDFLRLRWNPFFPLMERRLLEFMGLEDTGNPHSATSR